MLEQNNVVKSLKRIIDVCQRRDPQTLDAYIFSRDICDIAAAQARRNEISTFYTEPYYHIFCLLNVTTLSQKSIQKLQKEIEVFTANITLKKEETSLLAVSARTNLYDDAQVCVRQLKKIEDNGPSSRKTRMICEPILYGNTAAVNNKKKINGRLMLDPALVDGFILSFIRGLTPVKQKTKTT